MENNHLVPLTLCEDSKFELFFFVSDFFYLANNLVIS